MSRYIKKAKIPGVSSSGDTGGDFQAVTAVTIEASSMKTTSFKSDYMEVPQSRIRVNESDNFTRPEGNRWVVIDYCDDMCCTVQSVSWTGQKFYQYEELQLTWSNDHYCTNNGFTNINFGNSGCLFTGCCYTHTEAALTGYSATMRCVYPQRCGVCVHSNCSAQNQSSSEHRMHISRGQHACASMITGTFCTRGSALTSNSCHIAHGGNFLFNLATSCGGGIYWHNFDQMQMSFGNCRRPNFGHYELLGRIKSTGPSCIED